MREPKPDRFEAEGVISVAGIRSGYNARIILADKIEPRSLRVSGNAKGIFGHSSGEAHIRLDESGANTRLRYRYRAKVGGRVAGIGHRMLGGVVNVLANQFFSGLARHLDPSAPYASPSGRTLSRFLGWIRTWFAR